ncbi:hypothetical protein LUZ60_013714 [Juncus effusus]|nr:hypothetical protein LUZ60_013714 [Juncus effusus]
MERISRNLCLNCDTESSITPINGNLASNPKNREITIDVALKNISNKLFDENIDVSPNEPALRAIEKSLDDILKQKYPSFRHSNLPQSITQSESSPILEFKRGMEEGMKFLPTINNNQLMDEFLQDNKVPFPSKNKKDHGLVGRKLKESEEEDRDIVRLNGKKHANSEDLFLVEGRKCKISVLYFKNRDDDLQSETKLEIHESSIDLMTLLIRCSQKIAQNHTQNANQVIKQIRKRSSPNGNGVQRMARIFVDGLDARLNGTNSELYQQCLMPPQETMPDCLDAFHIPILKASQHYAIPIIINAIGKGSKLHIINLGREFDFHWPSLIQALSVLTGGTPKLRITNIETPISGFSPTERIEGDERKLEGLARRFGVPLEYRGMATKWDEICIGDLSIEKDEVLIVTCLRGWEYLGDEFVMYSPKNRVLDIIRQIRPHLFIQGVINGSFSSSFFADRFKQVLLYSSALFDMFDATIPRGDKQRQFLENNLWGRVAFNVIACEGSERFIRPETYKQWHIRNSRAGFEQLPLDRAMLKRIEDKVRGAYHKNFFAVVENEWILLAWKGRAMSALSTWRPRQA